MPDSPDQKKSIQKTQELFQGQALAHPNWLARLTKEQRRRIEYVLALLFVLFFICQMYQTRRNVLEAAMADSSPIDFSTPWQPDRKEYKPGDIIKLKYTRTVKFNPETPLLVISINAFENQTTGEIFGGSIIGRVIQKPGTAERTTVIKIPEYATEGTYIFEGWMRAETSRRSIPKGFQSLPFTIKK